MARKCLILLLLSCLAPGCASFIKFDVPKDLKKGKLVEDPPLSRAPMLEVPPSC